MLSASAESFRCRRAVHVGNDNFMEVAFLLEELLGRKVKVVTPNPSVPPSGLIFQGRWGVSLSPREYIRRILDEIDHMTGDTHKEKRDFVIETVSSPPLRLG